MLFVGLLETCGWPRAEVLKAFHDKVGITPLTLRALFDLVADGIALDG